MTQMAKRDIITQKYSVKYGIITDMEKVSSYMYFNKYKMYYFVWLLLKR